MLRFVIGKPRRRFDRLKALSKVEDSFRVTGHLEIRRSGDLRAIFSLAKPVGSPHYVHMNIYRIRAAFLRRRVRRPKPTQLELNLWTKTRR